MKIVITGVTGFRNRGVEALVRPTIDSLLELFPQAKLEVITWSPDYDSKRYPHPRVSYVEDHYASSGSWMPKGNRNLKQQIGDKLKRKFVPAPPPGPVEMPFSDADLVIISGGDLLSSDYGTDSLRHFLRPVEWAKTRGIPVVLVGQSIGPFKNQTDVDVFKQAAELATLVTMREPLSRNYLLEELGLSAEKILLTADSAFLLVPETDFADQQLPAFTNDHTSPLVGISISESICQWTGNDYDKHIEVWCDLIRMMVEKWNAKVVLLAHVQERFSDDRLIGTNILRRIGFNGNVRLVAEDLSAGEFKGILRKCDMVVAERMHAAIGAISTGVCTVPIGYSVKARGIIESVLEGSGISSEEMCIPIAQLLDFGHSSEKLTKVWTERARYKSAVEASLQRSKDAAARNFQLVSQLVKK